MAVADLIARREYGRAIDVLKVQLQKRPLDPHTQLSLADALVQAGRTAEAVPVFMELSRVFAAEGFFAKAVAVLKRVDKIAPGRADVSETLALCIEKQRGPRTEAPPLLPPPRPAERGFEFGMEELGVATLTRLRAPKAWEPPPEPEGEPGAPPPVSLPPASPAEVPAEPVPPPFAEVVPSPGPEPPIAAPPVPEPPALEPAPIEPAPTVAEVKAPEGAAPIPVPSPAPDAPAVAGDIEAPISVRLRGLMSRVLSYVRQSPEGPASAALPSAAPPSAEPGGATPLATPTASVPPEALETLPPAAEPPMASLPDVVMGTEEFRAHVLDLVQDLAQQPAPPLDAPPPASEPPVLQSPTDEPPDVYMGTEEFRAQVLDLVQDLAQQPAQAPAHAVEAAPPADAAPPPSSNDAAATTDESPPVPAALFDSTALLAALTPDEILALVGELGLVRAEPGDVVVTEGEPGDSLFLIGSGRVRVFVGSPGGRRFAVGELRDGDFFGEIAALSRRPRAATVTAAEECDLLRLDRDRLEVLTRERPHIREVLEDFYLRRAESPAAAAVRVLPRVDVSTERRAVDILDAYFGESRWDPRVRLRLAQALARAGQEDDAIAILATLADEMARAGFPEKAVALFKKIEGLPKAPVMEVKLAPLERPRFREEDMRPAPEAAKDELGRWLVELARDTAPSAPRGDAAAETLAPHAYTGLRASPLFDGLSEDDRLALVSGLELKTAVPGDILVTEGEPGESIFVLASGSAKVYVKDADGRSVQVGGLPEGSFFGEVGALSGGVRRATVVASARCELLTLTRDALDGMTARHPRIREVIEQYYAERTRS